MIYWSEQLRPRVEKDPMHVAPWAVMLNGYVCARVSKKGEAEKIATAIRRAVPKAETP